MMKIHRKDAKTQRNSRAKEWRGLCFIALFSLRLCAFAVNSHAQTNPQNAALLAFKREQIALVKSQKALFFDGGQKALAGLQKRVAQIESATGDAAQTPFTLHERAYFAPDGSAQPFWIALPANYSPTRKWPLAVFLHGYSEGISKLSPWFPPAEFVDAATRRGLILAIPYGRRNSDFVQWGEDDVLRVKNEVLAHYAIDENRVLLCGTSMGGYGASAVGLHDPSQWRAVAPIAARADFYLWFKTSRESLPHWKRALYDADDPRFLASNARQTPFLVQHGALDVTVPVEHSRRLFADARRLGLPLQYLEDPAGDHNFEFQFAAISRAFDWFLSLPAPVLARSVELVAVDPREAKNGWASIEAFEVYGQKASLKATIEGQTLRVETENVAKFTLSPPAALWNGAPTLKLRVDGVESGDFAPGKPILWQKPGAKSEKSPLRCGPFKNALRDPFLLVYGDVKDRKDAERFALEWKACTDGNAPIKAASEISEADKADFNLILLGTRDSNPLLAEIADTLPLELLKTGYRSGKKQIAGKDFGLRMVWKSPWSEKRVIGVCSGAWWGEKLPLNHKWDLIPDDIVYGEKTEADDTNAALEAGFFDGSWSR